MTDPVGPGKFVHHVQNPSYAYDRHVPVCMLLHLEPHLIGIKVKTAKEYAWLYFYTLYRHMESGLRMVQYTYLICMGVGPSILSVIAKSLAYSGPSYPSSPVFVKVDYLLLYFSI